MTQARAAAPFGPSMKSQPSVTIEKLVIRQYAVAIPYVPYAGEGHVVRQMAQQQKLASGDHGYRAASRVGDVHGQGHGREPHRHPRGRRGAGHHDVAVVPIQRRSRLRTEYAAIHLYKVEVGQHIADLKQEVSRARERAYEFEQAAAEASARAATSGARKRNRHTRRRGR